MFSWFLQIYFFFQLQENEDVLTFFPSVPHARAGAQRGGDGREDGDGDVQNLLPDSFVFHVL